MKIPFKQSFDLPGEILVKKCGYGKIYDRRSDQESFVRRLHREHYPRFHMYINSEKPLTLSLHLDQKKASYEGHTAHSGDYDSSQVREEAARIYYTILDEVKKRKEKEQEPEKKKGFFGMFGGK